MVVGAGVDRRGTRRGREGEREHHEGVGVRRAERSICASERPLSSEYLRAVITVGIVDVLYIRLFTSCKNRSATSQEESRTKTTHPTDGPRIIHLVPKADGSRTVHRARQPDAEVRVQQALRRKVARVLRERR